MIPDDYFTYWIANVVAHAKLIADPNILARVWIDGETSVTSAYSSDELLEQLLGDLHLQELVEVFTADLEKLDALGDVHAFTKALIDIELMQKSNLELEVAVNLLQSPQWKTLMIFAGRISELPASRLSCRNPIRDLTPSTPDLRK